MGRLAFESILGALAANGKNTIDFYEGRTVCRKTFAELYRDVVALSAWLKTAGIGPGQRVGLRFDNEYYWVVLDLACLATGAVSVPFHSDIPSFDVSEACRRFDLAALFEADRVRVVAGGAMTTQARPSLTELQGEGPREIEHASWAPDDPFTILFTSGSTGFPKAITLRMKSVTDFLVNIASMFEFRDNDRVIVFMPLSHFGQRSYIYAAIMLGIDVALVPAGDLAAAFRRHRPTMMVAVPFFFEGIYSIFKEAPDPGAVSKFLGGAMRLMVTGSAPMRRDVLRFFEDLGMTIFEGYGTTETGLIALNYPGAHRLGSVGRVFPNKEVVISPEGEVLVRGEFCWADRYLNQPESVNRAVFGSDGFIHTGDIGAFDQDGFLYLKGRLNELIVFSNGKKAYPFEVEATLRASGSISQACVFLHEDVLKAVVVGRSGVTAERLAEAVAAANTKLPDYARIRSYSVSAEPFSVENGLLTSSFKINRPRVVEVFAREPRAGTHR